MMRLKAVDSITLIQCWVGADGWSGSYVKDGKVDPYFLSKQKYELLVNAATTDRKTN